MMSKCSIGPKCLSKARPVMLLLLMTEVFQVSGAGVEMTARHGRGNGDGNDDDGGDDGGSHDPNREQGLDMGGLQDSLKTGGANGLADMLAAMGSIKHDTQLIPITKDADGNEMYNFGALGMTTPAPVAITVPPSTTVSASLVEPVSAKPSTGVVAAIPQVSQVVVPAVDREKRAAEEVAAFRGLRGANAPKGAEATASANSPVPQPVSAPAASETKKESAPVQVVPAITNQESPTPNEQASVQPAPATNSKASVESLRQGLTAIRDHIDSLMTESDNMLFGSQVNMRTQAAEQSPTVQLAPESAGQQQRWAEMLRRVSALEEEHTQLQQQVHAQSDHIQALETGEDKEKQQLNATVEENSVLRADANDDRKQMLLLEQQSKQLQADDTDVKKRLGSVEQENKHLQSVVKARHKQHAAIQKVGLLQTATRDKGHTKVSRKIAGRQGKHHQKSHRRKAAVH